MALRAALPLRMRRAQGEEALRTMTAHAITAHQRAMRHGGRRTGPGTRAVRRRFGSLEGVLRERGGKDGCIRRAEGSARGHMALRATAAERRMADLRGETVLHLQTLRMTGQTGRRGVLHDGMRHGGRRSIIGTAAGACLERGQLHLRRHGSGINRRGCRWLLEIHE